MKERPISESEYVVLSAIYQLKGNGYGVTIRQEVEEKTGISLSIGALYFIFAGLEDKGYIKSRVGESTPERGNRPKKYFTMDISGMWILASSKEKP